MTLCGPVVLDIVQHFVERWNEVKRRKVYLHLFQSSHCLLTLYHSIDTMSRCSRSSYMYHHLPYSDVIDVTIG